MTKLLVIETSPRGDYSISRNMSSRNGGPRTRAVRWLSGI